MVFDIAWVVAAVLVVAAFWDAKTAKIPNWLVLGLAALFVVKLVIWPGSADILWQVGFAAAVFAGGFGLFAAGAMGAGAVKLAAATALFMPLDRLGTLGLAMIAAIIVAMIVIGFLRGTLGSEDSSWACLRKRIIPMAVPIGITGIVGLFAL